MMELVTAERPQFLAYFAISLAVTICTAILTYYDKDIYKPFLGPLNPLLVVVSLSVLGFFLLAFLLSRGWFAIYEPTLQGLAAAGGLALVFALVMIFVDSRSPLPENINRLPPQGFFFYPSIAFVVEILFHVLPLTLILFLLSALPGNLSFDRFVWPAIIVTALLEPLFQAGLDSNRDNASWVSGYIILHIFLINLCQLTLFKRYDFVSMFSFRLVYYLVWHIIWGVLRLKFLF